MGRYKRKKRVYGGDPTDRDSRSQAKVFTTGEKKRLIQYLRDYRNRARVQATGFPQQNARDNASAPTSIVQQVQIASLVLPALTKELLSQPYLQLPCQMTGQQKKIVHECCVSVGLYHCGVGEHGSAQRYVAISIYVDGIAFLDKTIAKPDYLGFYRPFRPWFYRSDNSLSRDETTKAFRDYKIQALIDQPGKCIRDGIDDVDLKALEGDDLSNMFLPEVVQDSTGKLVGEMDQWLLVDTTEKMDQCIKELLDGDAKEISFDVEAYNVSKYVQLTCLLQVSSNLGIEYIIDVLAPGVWDRVGGLAPLFSDPNIVKVGHSIGGLDVHSLHRDFGLFICNAFDTYEAAKVLNLTPQGLSAVSQYYGLNEPEIFTKLKATYQTTDWRRRPLTKEMILYARYDVHFLLKLRLLMVRDLIKWKSRPTLEDIEAESKLVAAALAATLQSIKDSEDAGYDEPANSLNNESCMSTKGGEDQVDDNDNAVTLDAAESDDDDDDDEFFTPQTSIRWGDENMTLETSTIDPNSEIDHYGVATKNDDPLPQKVTASVIRMQPELMRVISLSQERCRDLWTARSEPHFRNAVFMSLMHQSNKGGGKKNRHFGDPMSDAQVKLYEDLVRLRSNTAKKLECIPHFICSLNDLALIASVRPTSLDELRLISYFLPESIAATMDDPDSFTRQIFALTTKSLKEDNNLVKNDPNRTVLRFNDRSRVPSAGEGSGPYRTVRRVALVSAIVGGVALTVMALSRRRRGK